MRGDYRLGKMKRGALVRILLLVAMLLAQALPAVAVGPDEGPVSDLLSGRTSQRRSMCLCYRWARLLRPPISVRGGL